MGNSIHRDLIFGEKASAREKIQASERLDRLKHVSEISSVRITALHVAAFQGYEDIVDLILERGLNIDIQSGWNIFPPGQQSPFLFCLWHGKIRAALYLLKKGANILATDAAGQNCLHTIAEASFLIDDKNWSKMFLDFIRGVTDSGSGDVLRQLVAMRDNTKKELPGCTPLHAACAGANRNEHTFMAVAKVFIACGADPHADGAKFEGKWVPKKAIDVLESSALREELEEFSKQVQEMEFEQALQEAMKSASS